MSATKHTPGPWWIDEHSAEVYGQGRAKEDASRCIVQFSERFTKQERADARLIAAAPELLSALVECLPLLEVACESTDDPDASDKYERACAAIAKAQGEP